MAAGAVTTRGLPERGRDMAHPIIEDLLWRHAVKKYDASKRIPEKDLDVLFEAMRLSPSSINSQPWKFVVFFYAANSILNRELHCVCSGFLLLS